MKEHPRPQSSGTTPVSGLQNNANRRNIIYPDSKRRKVKLVTEYLIDYTENSNLHGLKYVGDKERTTVEKIFWLLMFICSVVGCSIVIRKVWIKWNESPVIVSFAEKSTPVWQIPYPAITLCSETKAMQTIYNYTAYSDLYDNETALANLTQEEKNMYEDISIVCEHTFPPTDGRKFSDGNLTVRNIIKVAPTIDDIFVACLWKRTLSLECEEYFSPIITEEGLCYTFNTLAADELLRTKNLHSDYEYVTHRNSTQMWTLEDGYSSSTSLETYPYRGSGNGVKNGLEIILVGDEANLDYRCKGPAQGFKIMLHNPAEFPRVTQQYFRVPLAQEVVVAIKPKMMTTSEGLKKYKPIRRQCYFQYERYLRYFKVYTQANCKTECLSNFTFAVCGCVHFAMPRSSNMTVCNRGRMECLQKAQFQLVNIEILSEMETETYNITASEDWNEWNNMPKRRKIAEQCHCLPACTSLEYEAETSQVDLNWKAVYESYSLDSSFSQRHSRVLIYFKEEQFIMSRRSELYGLSDFLANCGGLLGLFMGFSILSVAEILYFLTLRLCCIFRRRRILNSMKRDVHDSRA